MRLEWQWRRPTMPSSRGRSSCDRGRVHFDRAQLAFAPIQLILCSCRCTPSPVGPRLLHEKLHDLFVSEALDYQSLLLTTRQGASSAAQKMPPRTCWPAALLCHRRTLPAAQLSLPQSDDSGMNLRMKLQLQWHRPRDQVTGSLLQATANAASCTFSHASLHRSPQRK